MKNERRNKLIKRTVLVADDEAINRLLLGKIIGDEYTVIYAEDGEKALEIIKENSRSLSLVLLDLRMPGVDGSEILKIMKADRALRRIPVIVMTAEKQAEVDSLRLGAADFITKPYDMPEVIRARIKRSIQLAEDKVIISATENDPLTGLFNRSYFYSYCDKLDRFGADIPMDAVVLNINRFHLFNELHGHELGDAVLKTIAKAILNFLGSSRGIACRCESDVFYVYIESGSDWGALLDAILNEIRQEHGELKLSLRAGIYENTPKDMEIARRFDRANSACKGIRHGYSSKFAFYDLRLREKEVLDEELITSVDRALAERQFEVWLQPKYGILGDEPVLKSAEALVRWKHPEKGMISPGVFIPLFEHNGLIRRLDSYVWREAASMVKRLEKEENVKLSVSVNVSRIDLSDPELTAELEGLTEEFGIEPDRLLLEVTESAYTETSAEVVKAVNKLRASGFKIEMDDFGSGFSSLNMLTDMPIDVLKLDMAFIRNISRSEKDRKMLELMRGIAYFLEVPVIAEGVETEEQYLILKEIGIDIIQGYYFSKPLPYGEFAALCKKDV